MELISNYKTRLLNGEEKESDNDYKSETTIATSFGGEIDYNDLFGNSDVALKTGAPVKGRKYLLFTIVMCIVLSVMVCLNSSAAELQRQADKQIEDDKIAQRGIDFTGGPNDSTTDTTKA